MAAVGDQNLLMCEPPGASETLMARVVPSIMMRVALHEVPEMSKV